MTASVTNPLLSSQKSSDTGLQVALHPLPLLEISDYITRAYQRGLKGAVVGGLLGQQNGREISVEHSFPCKTEKSESTGEYELDLEWFGNRLEQMKAVHMNPPLDLVGWYTLCPKSGPTSSYLPIHNQVLAQNESAILLGFHVEELLSKSAAGDPLPLTLYESNLEADDGANRDAAVGEDAEMRDAEAPVNMTLKFRELPYTTETSEAEIIAMQFVREGGANATAENQTKTGKAKASKGKGKGKPKESATEAAPTAGGTDDNLRKEELEFLSALQAKANAIRMMKSRLDLVVAYLSKLPPSFAAGEVSSAEAAKLADGSHTVPSNNILRQIQALTTNMHLITPEQQDTLEKEIQVETNDVKLVALLSDLMNNMSNLREVGKKFAAVESVRHQRTRQLLPSFVDHTSSAAGDLIT